MKNHSLVHFLLLIGLFWLLSGCSAEIQTPPVNNAAPSTPDVIEDTAEPTEPVEPVEPAGQTTPTVAAAEPTQPQKSPTEYPPAVYKEEVIPSPEQIAVNLLASRLGITPDQVSLASAGDWTNEPIPCELELSNTKMSQMLQGEHRQLVLEVKGNTYEYWVFRSVAGLPMAFTCR